MLDLERLYAERVVYSIPGMDKVGVREDLVYRTLEDQELKLDVYYPTDYRPGEKLPAAILVHGEWPPHHGFAAWEPVRPNAAPPSRPTDRQNL